MELNEIKILTKKIEDEFDVNQITYKGIKMWPIIKSVIVFNLKNNRFEPSRISISKTEVFNLIIWWLYKIIFSLNTNYKSLYFISDFIAHSVEVNGKYIHRFYNPLKRYIKIENIGCWEVLDFRRIFVNKAWKSKCLSYYYYKSRLKSKLNIGSDSSPVQNFELFFDYLEENSLDNLLGRKEVEFRILYIHIFSEYIKKLIVKSDIKKIYLSCFYDELSFAITLAGYRAGIEVIEVQHGQQGDNHPLYTNWNSIPEEGYELIPNIFWMWGDESAKRIKRWAQNTIYHKIHVSGNPWLTYCINESLDLNNKHTLFLNDLKTENKIRVLVSLQYPEIPPIITKLLNRNDAKEILWLFRMHPRTLSYMPNLQSYMKGYTKSGNWEIINSSKIPYSELIKEVDIQITLWSTVAYEALAYDVNTILIHENGRAAMQKYIKRGIFAYTENADELLDLIIKGINSKKETKPYIEHGIELLNKPKKVD